MIRIPFKETELVGDVMPEGAQPRVLFLHGAGATADRHRLQDVREALAKDGIASAAFDFIGHGETGCDLSQSSLKERTEQAVASVGAFNMIEPITVIGGSMSGYTAVKLTEFVAVDKLVLIVPAMYRADVYDVPFAQFTEAIREPESWRKSDAWEILSRFKGDLLIVQAELDTVIPSAVIDEIYQSASAARSREWIVVQGSTHKIAHFMAEHPEAFEMVYKKIRALL